MLCKALDELLLYGPLKPECLRGYKYEEYESEKLIEEVPAHLKKYL